jgi:hypothetical protein
VPAATSVESLPRPRTHGDLSTIEIGTSFDLSPASRTQSALQDTLMRESKDSLDGREPPGTRLANPATTDPAELTATARWLGFVRRPVERLAASAGNQMRRLSESYAAATDLYGRLSLAELEADHKRRRTREPTADVSAQMLGEVRDVAADVSSRAASVLAGTSFIAAAYVSIYHRGAVAGAALTTAGLAAYSAATAQTGATSAVLFRQVKLDDVYRAHRRMRFKQLYAEVGAWLTGTSFLLTSCAAFRPSAWRWVPVVIGLAFLIALISGNRRLKRQVDREHSHRPGDAAQEQEEPRIGPGGQESDQAHEPRHHP